MRARRTARVMVFDPAGRVLLIRCVVMRRDGEFVFWLTPGGEIEAGEEPIEAARRELAEELGLEVEVVGPVYTEANRFEHQGEMRDNLDFVFTARCAAGEPALRGVTADEIAIMKEIRWWSAEEVEASGERIFPVDLAARMREFAM
jgi:ADP-ribose pyrophosphatase YjhB (NUDIX family)